MKIKEAMSEMEKGNAVIHPIDKIQMRFTGVGSEIELMQDGQVISEIGGGLPNDGWEITVVAE